MKLLGTLILWFFAAPLCIPWILIRVGKYKRWYLAPFVPPFIWGRAFYGWPATAVFIFSPILAVLPVSDDTFMSLLGWISLVGVVLGIIMMIWTPGWAKPKWQRYLEAKYTGSEIRSTLIPVWRKMDRKKWSQLLDSEEGIEELVRIARQEKYGYP